jgi:hypothetical protein
MHGQAKAITTPNPKAAPPSAVKDVGESRQERLKRQQARFRDRGGYVRPGWFDPGLQLMVLKLSGFLYQPRETPWLVFCLVKRDHRQRSIEPEAVAFRFRLSSLHAVQAQRQERPERDHHFLPLLPFKVGSFRLVNQHQDEVQESPLRRPTMRSTRMTVSRGYWATDAGC